MQNTIIVFLVIFIITSTHLVNWMWRKFKEDKGWETIAAVLLSIVYAIMVTLDVQCIIAVIKANGL